MTPFRFESQLLNETNIVNKNPKNHLWMRFNSVLCYFVCMDTMYTVREAAEILSYTPETIRRFIRMGRIEAFKIGLGPKAEYRISESELQRVQQINTEEHFRNIKDYIKKDNI